MELNGIFELMPPPIFENESEIVNIEDNEFFDKMSRLSDDELKLILVENRVDYVVEALNAAEFVLKKRGSFNDELENRIKKGEAKLKSQSQIQKKYKGNLYISLLFAFLTFIVVTVIMSSFRGGIPKILPAVSAYMIFKFIRD